MNLGALVKTDKGEGFLVGQTDKAAQFPRYDVRLASCGTICHAYQGEDSSFPLINEVELIDNHPVDHPLIPAYLRDYLIKHAAASVVA